MVDKINSYKNESSAPGGRVAAAKHFSTERCFGIIKRLGDIAQLIECFHGMEEVEGLSPSISTRYNFKKLEPAPTKERALTS